MAQQSFHEKVASIARKLAHTFFAAQVRELHHEHPCSVKRFVQAIRDAWDGGRWGSCQLAWCSELNLWSSHVIALKFTMPSQHGTGRVKIPTKDWIQDSSLQGYYVLGFKTSLRLSSPGADPSLGVGRVSQNESNWGLPLRFKRIIVGLLPLLLQKVLTDTYKETCKYQLFKKFLKFSNASKMGNSSSITFGKRMS